MSQRSMGAFRLHVQLRSAEGPRSLRHQFASTTDCSSLLLLSLSFSLIPILVAAGSRSGQSPVPEAIQPCSADPVNKIQPGCLQVTTATGNPDIRTRKGRAGGTDGRATARGRTQTGWDGHAMTCSRHDPPLSMFRPIGNPADWVAAQRFVDPFHRSIAMAPLPATAVSAIGNPCRRKSVGLETPAFMALLRFAGQSAALPCDGPRLFRHVRPSATKAKFMP